MNIKELEKLQNEGVENLPSSERRAFLKAGLAITGVFLGGSILSLTSTREARAALGGMSIEKYPYSPHYSMVIRQNRCIDCERCKEACVKTNHVPSYGYRTTILEVDREIGPEETVRDFMPILCNHCNRPPCVRVCPTKATYKDKKTGIVMMEYKKCIGCKTCMSACPYNARYFKEENRAVDKCNFCYDTRLTKGEKLTACAAACPADVRVFGDISDPKSRVYQLVHKPDKIVWVLRPETGALPNVYYMND
ncbi:MAG: 4Fe-4S dicluster domain-containing protein [Desulfobulbaceae bacterium]|nr:4Fe-4S dicluster domain-containing protein [Desulfobulbaceae bacterium]